MAARMAASSCDRGLGYVVSDVVSGAGPTVAEVRPEAFDGELSAQDAKLVTLARSSRLRAYVPGGWMAEGAAVRDTDGRTYSASTVEIAGGRLSVSALRAAVVAAASSGARRFEAAAIVSAADVFAADDLAALAEFGPSVPVYLAGTDGVPRGQVST
jgi:hypothetical protein